MNNPYSPPIDQSAASAAAGPVRGHHPALKWIYLVAAIVAVVLYGAQIYATISFTVAHVGATVPSSFGSRPPSPIIDDPATQLFTALYLFAALTAAGLGLAWLGFAWAAIPEMYRVTAGGKRVSPGTAVGFMLIPCFSFYWLFVAVVGLTDALNGVLTSSGCTRRAPRGLAIGACVCYLVPCTTMFVAPILWFILMWQVDDALKEYLSRPPPAAYAPPAPYPYPYGG
jgi:hypothetical protein